MSLESRHATAENTGATAVELANEEETEGVEVEGVVVVVVVVVVVEEEEKEEEEAESPGSGGTLALHGPGSFPP